MGTGEYSFHKGYLAVAAVVGMGAVEPAVFEVPVRRVPATAECEIRAGSLALVDPVERIS